MILILASAILYGIWPKDKDFFIATGLTPLKNWYEEKIKTGDILTDEVVPVDYNQSITDTEKKKIDDWILKNNLNKYGDPKDTVYTGGTPLFNEMTGKAVDRYEYILKRHPDRPWNN